MESLHPPANAPALQIQLSRIALVSAPDMFWLPEEASRYFDVHQNNVHGEKIGEAAIDYRYAEKYARPHLTLQVQRSGIGTEIYTAIPFIPLPDGEDFRENGFHLRSTNQSYAANRLWKSLVRKGMATTLDQEGHFELLNNIPAPVRLEIIETGMLPKLSTDS